MTFFQLGFPKIYEETDYGAVSESLSCSWLWSLDCPDKNKSECIIALLLSMYLNFLPTKATVHGALCYILRFIRHILRFLKLSNLLITGVHTWIGEVFSGPTVEMSSKEVLSTRSRERDRQQGSFIILTALHCNYALFISKYISQKLKCCST